MANESRRRFFNRMERLLFAIGIVLIACLARHYRSLPAFDTNEPARDPNILRTSPEADSIVGFGGPTPAVITLDPASQTIKTIEFLPNAEDFDYWVQVENAEIFAKYIGKTPEEAALLPVDAVSGATMSAHAAQETLLRRFRLYDGTVDVSGENGFFASLGGMDILVALVFVGNFLLLRAGSRIRFWLSIVNVVVLGFGAYSYLSFARIAGWINTTPHWRFSFSLILLLVVVAVAAVWGRNMYCGAICPYGCAQDVATWVGKRLGASVWKISFRYGPLIRRVVLSGSILAMICGLAFRLPEPFSLFQMTGPDWVLAAGAFFILAAVFVPRIWCRWLCPCGALLDNFAKTDKKQIIVTENTNDLRARTDTWLDADSGAGAVSSSTTD